MQFIAVVALLAFVDFASANYKPVFGPEGNPFSQPDSKVGFSAPTIYGANINSQSTVHACYEYHIAWTPTTPNNISLYLLINSDTLPITTIVAGVKNDGHHLWEPSRLLMEQNWYSIQLVDDVTGQWQVLEQFHIWWGSNCEDHDPISMTPPLTGDDVLSTSNLFSRTPISSPMSSDLSSASTESHRSQTTLSATTIAPGSLTTPASPAATSQGSQSTTGTVASRSTSDSKAF